MRRAGAHHRLLDVHGGTAQGLGLGLAIVDRVASMLDHEVSLRSNLGKGSVFAVTVPMGAKVAAEAGVAEMPEAR